MIKLYDWQEKVLNNLRKGNSVSINAPTGSGKTFPGVLYIKEILPTLKANEKIFWLVPYKSLAFDKYNELSEQFGRDNVGILTGEYKENYKEAKIIVAIYESFMNKIRNNTYSKEDVRFVVMDEIHTIDERENIYSITEFVINNNFQYYAISATFNDLKYYCYNSKYYKVDDTDNKFSMEKVVIRAEYPVLYSDELILSNLRRRHQILVFQFSIKRIRKEIERVLLKNIFPKKYENMEGVDDSLLRQALEHGIGFYTSDLSNNDKALVIKLYNERRINVVYTTDAIATGVNLPCDIIILREIKKYHEDKLDYLDENLLIQLYGRAGRKGKSTTALIYIPTDAPKYFEKPKQRNLLDFGTKVFGRLMRVFA